jgi:hypothetical protein
MVTSATAQKRRLQRLQPLLVYLLYPPYFFRNVSSFVEIELNSPSFVFSKFSLLLGHRCGRPFPKWRKACRRPPYASTSVHAGAYLGAAGGDAYNWLCLVMVLLKSIVLIGYTCFRMKR